ncbi:MAG: NAD(P)-dependent oxidoreductase [Candidatus Algichlamydia australiensis]|nr:NAD(P)-dependent oxidoreductase [Chlamydiales bacterium]
MRVAVTGATGFLGQQIVAKLLKKKCDVIALGRNKKIGSNLGEMGARFVKADLNSWKEMACAFDGCSAVIHSAALSSPWGSKRAFYEANVLGTRNVLRAIEFSNVQRIVHISTPSVYFDYTDRLQISEDEQLPRKMVNQYARSKLEAEKIVMKAFEQGLETIIIRPRALFGPGDTTLFPRLIKANNLIGIPITNPKPILTDLTYVENAADAALLCLNASRICLGKAYNITDGEPTSLEELLKGLFSSLNVFFRKRRVPYSLAFGLALFSEGIGTLIGKEPSLTRYGIGVLSRSMTLDISRAKMELGYHPQVRTQEGIARFICWWKSGGANG